MPVISTKELKLHEKRQQNEMKRIGNELKEEREKMTTTTNKKVTTEVATEKEDKTLRMTGLAYYAKVHEPQNSRDYKTVYRYSVGLRVDNDDPQVVAFKKMLKANKVTKTKVTKITDNNGSDTGKTQINFGRRAYYDETGEVQNPLRKIVDASGKTIPPTTLIGNGSKVTVAFTVKQNSNGNFLLLQGIQVLELIPYNPPEMFPITSQETDNEGVDKELDF